MGISTVSTHPRSGRHDKRASENRCEGLTKSSEFLSNRSRSLSRASPPADFRVWCCFRWLAIDLGVSVSAQSVRHDQRRSCRRCRRRETRLVGRRVVGRRALPANDFESGGRLKICVECFRDRCGTRSFAHRIATRGGAEYEIASSGVSRRFEPCCFESRHRSSIALAI